MDFIVLMIVFMGVVWLATRMDEQLREQNKPKKGSCPPHPWRQKRPNESGTHYLVCDRCGLEPSFVGRDTPQK